MTSLASRCRRNLPGTGVGMTDDNNTRLQRLRYRAARRGSRELDMLLGRYAEYALESMNENELEEFGAFLRCPNPLIQAWIVNGDDAAAGEFRELVRRIRMFHAH